jgi:hypothetical protein
MPGQIKRQHKVMQKRREAMKWTKKTKLKVVSLPATPKQQ